MKKILMLAIVSLILTTTGVAQSEAYTKKMTELVAQLDTAKSTDEYTSLAAAFERVADKEKTQWLPYYYASMCNVMQANFKVTGMGDNTAITDPAADKADALLKKALENGKENSETHVLNKMINSLRMMGNPMERYMQYGTAAEAALKKAKAADANNPRVYLLEAQDKYYTPEAFGGSKTEAKKLFEKAKELYGTHTPETALHPKWGKNTVAYFLSLYTADEKK